MSICLTQAHWKESHSGMSMDFSDVKLFIYIVLFVYLLVYVLFNVYI